MTVDNMEFLRLKPCRIFPSSFIILSRRATLSQTSKLTTTQAVYTELKPKQTDLFT